MADENHDLKESSTTSGSHSLAQDKSGEVTLHMDDILKAAEWLPGLIILVSSVLGLMLVSGLFGPGIPMNIDLPFHYGRILCYENSPMWSLPTAWCTHGQAGIATFQGYATIPFHIVAMLSWVFGPLLAFKLMLVMVLFSLPLGAYFLLRTMGKPLAGAFAFAFLLLEHGGWHSGGFEKIFFVGLFSNALGSAMLLFTIAFAIRFLRDPNPPRFCLLVLSTVVFFLSHAATFMFYPIVLVILAVVYRNSVIRHWKWAIAYPALVFLLVGYWFLPFLYKMDYYVSAGGGTVKAAEISQYLWNGVNKILAFVGIVGLAFMILNRKKEYKVVGWCAGAIVGLWLIGFVWESFPYFSFIQMIRNLAELRSFLFIGAAVLLGYIASVKVKVGNKAHPWLIIPVILVVGLVMWQCYTVTDGSTKNMVLSTTGNIPTLEPLYKYVEPASGRVMVEDPMFTFGNSAMTLSHPWSASPAYSSKEFIGTGDNLYNKNDFSNTQQGVLLNSSINDWSDGALLEYLDELNIEYVIAFSQTYVGRFARLPGMTLASNSTPAWLIMKTPVTPRSIRLANGKIENSEYKGTWARATYDSPKETPLRMSVRHWPNWQATIDGNPLELRRGKMGLIEATVPAGKHTIQFTYRMIWIDWVGYLVSIIGAIILIWAWRKERL